MSDWYEKFTEAKSRQGNFTKGALQRLTKLVSTYMSKDGNFLVPTLDNLEKHESSLPSYIHGAYLEIATNTSLLRMARKDRDRVLGACVLQVRDYYRDHCSGRDGVVKLPTEFVMKAEVSQSPLMVEAEKELADAEDRLIVSQGLLKALEAKLTLLPGLQGQRNRLS